MAVLRYTQDAALMSYQQWLMQQGVNACLEQQQHGQRGIPPPAPQEGCCVRHGDRLLIEGNNSLETARIKVTWRSQLLNGQYVNNERILAPPHDRSQFREFIPLAPGCLCGLDISDPDGIACFGQLFFTAKLISGNDTDFQVQQRLTSGHVSANCGPSYNSGPSQSPLSGPGHNTQYEVSNPAIGANFTYTGDAMTLWRMREIRFTLTTSATVASRFARVSVRNWLNQETFLVPSQAQAASLAVDYSFQRGLNYLSPITTRINGNLPEDLVFSGQGVIESLVTNLQVGDRIQNVFFAVEEYLYLC